MERILVVKMMYFGALLAKTIEWAHQDEKKGSHQRPWVQMPQKSHPTGSQNELTWRPILGYICAKMAKKVDV